MDENYIPTDEEINNAKEKWGRMDKIALIRALSKLVSSNVLPKVLESVYFFRAYMMFRPSEFKPEFRDENKLLEKIISVIREHKGKIRNDDKDIQSFLRELYNSVVDSKNQQMLPYEKFKKLGDFLKGTSIMGKIKKGVRTVIGEELFEARDELRMRIELLSNSINEYFNSHNNLTPQMTQWKKKIDSYRGNAKSKKNFNLEKDINVNSFFKVKTIKDAICVLDQTQQAISNEKALEQIMVASQPKSHSSSAQFIGNNVVKETLPKRRSLPLSDDKHGSSDEKRKKFLEEARSNLIAARERMERGERIEIKLPPNIRNISANPHADSRKNDGPSSNRWISARPRAASQETSKTKISSNVQKGTSPIISQQRREASGSTKVYEMNTENKKSGAQTRKRGFSLDLGNDITTKEKNKVRNRSFSFGGQSVYKRVLHTLFSLIDDKKQMLSNFYDSYKDKNYPDFENIFNDLKKVLNGGARGAKRLCFDDFTKLHVKKLGENEIRDCINLMTKAIDYVENIESLKKTFETDRKTLYRKFEKIRELYKFQSGCKVFSSLGEQCQEYQDICFRYLSDDVKSKFNEIFDYLKLKEQFSPDILKVYGTKSDFYHEKLLKDFEDGKDYARLTLNQEYGQVNDKIFDVDINLFKKCMEKADKFLGDMYSYTCEHCDEYVSAQYIPRCDGYISQTNEMFRNVIAKLELMKKNWKNLSV